MKYYFKNSAVPFVFMIFESLTTLGIALIQIGWLMVMLEVLNIALYLFIISMYAFQCGTTAYKVKLQNDLERKIIINTGEDRPLKRIQEFRIWKGFFIALISCFPMLLALFVHLILMLASGGAYYGAGSVSAVIYYTFYHLAHVVCFGIGSNAFVSGWFLFSVLYCLPIICGQYGLMYILGAKKVKKTQDMINKTQEQIYGKECE